MILDLFFPNRCLECNRIIDGELLVCNLCFEHIHFMHYKYFDESFIKEKCKLLFPVENTYALMQFEKENLSRKIIHELKYKSREKVGNILANWTTERLDFKNEKPDLLVTVPLHPKKLKERGYNQLHLFTKTLSEFYNIPFDHDLIKRNHYSKAQALKDKQHRLETENTFSITENISGKHILLIDDVFTTGNTLASIAWEILKSGNNKVSVLVMAVDE
jgi:competence protein ComFC